MLETTQEDISSNLWLQWSKILEWLEHKK
jgi:hypothetical protein